MSCRPTRRRKFVERLFLASRWTGVFLRTFHSKNSLNSTLPETGGNRRRQPDKRRKIRNLIRSGSLPLGGGLILRLSYLNCTLASSRDNPSNSLQQFLNLTWGVECCFYMLLWSTNTSKITPLRSDTRGLTPALSSTPPAIKSQKTTYTHRRTGQFFQGSWAIFARKIFRQHPKNCYANLQNCFAQLTAPNDY